MSVVLVLLSLLSSPSYSLVLALTTLVGVGDALVQASLFPLAAAISPTLSASLLLGQGLAGLLVSFLKVTCKLSFKPTNAGTYAESRLYFGLGALLIVACLATLRHIQRRGLVKPLVISIEMSSPGKTLSPRATLASLVSLYKTILLHTALPTGVLFLTFLITLSLFPGITSQIPPPPNLPPSWFPVLISVTFNVGDWFGRGIVSYLLSTPTSLLSRLLLPTVSQHHPLPSSDSPPPVPLPAAAAITALNVLLNTRFLTILSLLRLAFIPLFLLLVNGAITSPTLVYLTTFLFAVTNGVLVTLSFVIGPQMIAGVEGKERVNGVLLMALVAGLATGSSVGAGLAALEND